jgi:hypothetical protein
MSTVQFSYYKRSGKYYSTGAISVPDDMPTFEIFRYARQLRDAGMLPGLVQGAKEFHILVEPIDHPNGYTGLMLLSDTAGVSVKLDKDNPYAEHCRSGIVVHGIYVGCVLGGAHEGPHMHEAYTFNSHRPKNQRYQNRRLTWWSSDKSAEEERNARPE